MIQRILISVILIFFIKSTLAQKSRQNLQILTYNVAFSGMAAGIGAMINKDNDVKWYKGFIKGFYQGAFGGLIVYSGKSLAYQINNQQNYWYSWPSKLVYAAGTSIVENAAMNNDFGKYWNIDLWAFRCDFSFKNSEFFKVRLLPSSIYSIIYFMPKGNFDLQRTIKTGSIVFTTNSIKNDGFGMALGKAISIRTKFAKYPDFNEFSTMSHELIHTFQYREYQIFNTWFEPFLEKIPQKTHSLLTKYVYWDISWYDLFYELQGGGTKNFQYFYKNFYELEAAHFATNKYISRKMW